MSQACNAEEVINSTELFMNCNHANLMCFPDGYDSRFISFLEQLNPMVLEALANVTPEPALRSRYAEPKTGQSQSASNTKQPTPPRGQEPPIPRDRAAEMYQYWTRKSQAEERRATRTAFLESLKGWSEANTGSLISPAPGTCHRVTRDGGIVNQLNSLEFTEFYLNAPAGRGKTYLLKALHHQLEAVKPRDTVLSFFCTPGTDKPPLWEYFTWALVKKKPAWFNEIPARYRGRHKESPGLEIGSFVDIWRTFKQTPSPNTIWLLVDGLEQCSGNSFKEFLSSSRSVFTYNLTSTSSAPGKQTGRYPSCTIIRFVFACRPTPAVIRGQATAAGLTLFSENIARDIATYVDLKLNRLGEAGIQISQPQLEELKSQIKKASTSYWPYARYAVQAVSESLPFGSMKDFNFEDKIPPGLRSYFDQQMLPRLQSFGQSWSLRTALTICASYNGRGPLTAKMIEAAVHSLDTHGQMKQTDLMQTVLTDYSDILTSRRDGSVSFVHASMAGYVNSLLSLEQRHTNMAFLCLRYLMQETYKAPLHLSEKGIEEGEKWLNQTHPFYDYAASEWTEHLRASKQLGEQLLPLIEEFASTSQLQYATWNEWNEWRYGPFPTLDTTEPIIMILVNEGCSNVLRPLFARHKPSTQSSSWAVKGWAADFYSQCRRTLSTRSRLCSNLDICGWPNTTDRKGRTALAAAVLSFCEDTVDLVLSHKPNLDASSISGETALMYSLPPLGLKMPRGYDSGVLEMLLSSGANPNTLNRVDGVTCLHLACSAGLVKATQILLRYSALVNVADIEGVTPLEWAYSSKNVELVEVLLDAGADVDIWWCAGKAPLARCIITSQLAMFRVFLQVADVNQRASTGVAPIHLVCELPDRLEYLKLLLTRPDIDLELPIMGFWGKPPLCRMTPRTAISAAAQRGDYPAVALLLQAGADPGTIVDMQEKPLHFAAMSRNTAVAQILLEHGARVNVYCRQCCFKTPLGIAVAHGNEEMVALFLKHGADPTIEEGYGVEGPLQRALNKYESNPSIVQQLLEAQIHPTLNASVDESKRHPLILAVGTGQVELVRMLLDHGASLEHWPGPGPTDSPLHVAIMENYLDICELLIQREPRLLDPQYEEGARSVPELPLHIACREGRASIVQLLLEKGAKADRLNPCKASCLFLACCTGDYEIVKPVLEAAPEMINAASLEGETPLSRACEHEDLRIVEMLLRAGAEINQRDCYGTSCINSEFFKAKSDRIGETLELLIYSGLDINAVATSRGHTILGVAIERGSPRDVKWLVDHKADPARCQHSPLGPVTWRNALQVACHSQRTDQMVALLEAGWMPKDSLRCRDWLGASILPIGPPRAWTVDMIRHIYWACEENRAETGDDVFAELMSQRYINGQTPVDWSLRPVSCTLGARRHIEDRMQAYIQELLPRPRNRDDHTRLIEELCQLLLYRGGSDAEAEALMSLTLSIPNVQYSKSKGGLYLTTLMVPDCHVCGFHDCEVCRVCVSCMTLCCDLCFAEVEPTSAIHIHEWMEVRLLGAWDWNSDEVQDILEKLCRRYGSSGGLGLSPITEEEPGDWDWTETEAGPDEGVGEVSADHELQATFQLALLHAFDRLAIRRSLFTSRLPLTREVETAIAPWTALIREQRKRVDRDNLSYESSRQRRIEEWSYIKRGLVNRYVDEDDVRYGQVLGDIRELHKEGRDVDDGHVRHDDDENDDEINDQREGLGDGNGDRPGQDSLSTQVD